MLPILEARICFISTESVARAESDDALFFEIEVMPRLRAIRNRLFQDSAPVRDARVLPSGNGHKSVELDNYAKAIGRRNRA